MKEIVIGRDASSQQLSLTYQGESVQVSSFGLLPQSVSRAHCLLRIGEEGSMSIENLNPDNLTFVNHVAVEKKTITTGDVIELGSDHFTIDLETILSAMPPIADIRPLEKIWNDYDESLFRLTVRERKFNAYRNGIGIFTMGALVLGLVFGRQPGNYIYIGMYVLAILLSILFFIISLREASKVPQKRKEITNRFQERYVCPHCGRNLGALGKYEMLRQNERCPYCKTKFIH